MIKNIYRVPLDFDWPVGAMWEGFVNPHHRHFVVCPECSGFGISKEARALRDIWYGATTSLHQDGVVDFGNIECEFGLRYRFTRRTNPHQSVLRRGNLNHAWMHLMDQDDIDTLVAHSALLQFTHSWDGSTWVAKDPAPILLPEQINQIAYDTPFHDYTNAWIAIEGVCQRANLQYRCPHCHGTGGRYPDPATQFTSLTWVPYEPPAGDGYQFWVPGDQGAPLSPVFATAEGLSEWLLQRAESARHVLNRENCLEFVRSQGKRGLPDTAFIWLCRDYQMNLKHVFHPALVQRDPYASS